MRAKVAMPKRPVLLLLWLAFVASTLIWTLIDYSSAQEELRREILIRHGILMLVFSLPSGWLLIALISAVLELFGTELVGVRDAVLVSLACGVAGYLQWFVVCPWLGRKWVAHRAPRRDETASG
jgi:hypothetical protein